MWENGNKVIVRIMECTNKKTNQWEVLYKLATITQKNIFSTSSKNLFTVELENGAVEHVWTEHILDCPREWA